MTPEQVGAFSAALFEGRNLKVGGTILLVALFTGQFMLAKVALLVYGILVLKTATNPKFVRRAAEEAAYVRGETRGVALPGGSGSRLKGKYLDSVRRARAVADEVRRQVAGVSDEFIRSQLDPMVPGIDAMVKRIDTLCAAAQELEVQATSGEKLAAEAAELERQAQSSTDEAARLHYESAIEQKRKMLENVAIVRQTSQRLEAELTSLGSALERFRSDVTRVVATGVLGSMESGQVGQDIGELANQMAALEATVEQLEVLKTEDRRTGERQKVR